MRNSRFAFLLPILIAAFLLPWAAMPLLGRAKPAVPESEDKTLQAMRDEMARSKERLALPGLQKPYYIEYRLVDMDVLTVRASFGTLISSDTSRSRFMRVGVRVGDYHLDNSNFLSSGAFQGFMGSNGEVGIDRDYSSLRQDLWLATDQAYKEALDQMSRKQAFLRALTKPPEIDDFAKETPLQFIQPRMDPDWTSRNWEDEARQVSAVLRNFPDVYSSRVTYHLIYENSYLLNSEGTEIRMPQHLAAIEAGLESQADDGMSLHNSYAVYRQTPAELPDAKTVSAGLTESGQQLEDLRTAPLMQDYVGPVLFDSQAAASLVAQLVEPSLSGARPPLSSLSDYDDRMDRLGGHSEWSGRIGTRVLPTTISLMDDPSATSFQGAPLIGGYEVDDEGVRAQKVNIVQDGMLRELLMSRRPGPESDQSNGHARSAILSDPRPESSNLYVQPSDGLSPDALKKKFLATCKDDGHPWCLEVRRMDNPVLALLSQEDFEGVIGGMASGISNGDRYPLLVYQVDATTGNEQLVRGGWLTGLQLRALRNAPAAGNDATVFNYMRNVSPGFAGTTLGAFGNAQSGIPSAVIAPSLLLDDVETRGYHGEPRRTDLLPPPPFH
jgi:predicted Zn-dependent protease